MHDIIDWDQANKAYTAGEGQSGERYIQRLEAADGWPRSEPAGVYGPSGVDHIELLGEQL